MTGGESFSPDDACDSAWNSVLSFTSSTKTLLGVFACSRTGQELLRFCADNHNYFQSKLKGMGRSAVCAATQVQVCGETVELPQLHLLVAMHWHGG